jgi:oligopeptidase B
LYKSIQCDKFDFQKSDERMILKNIEKICLFSLLVLLSSSCTTIPSHPKAEKHDTALVMFGDTRIDPYYWLSYRDSQKVIDYILAENTYTYAVMESTLELQKRLVSEMRSRKRGDDITVPVYMNGYYYYIKYEEGKEYPINCRRKGSMNAPEEIILDENEVAAGHRYCQIASIDISPDNNYMAYGVDTIGRRYFTIYFKDLATGRLLEHKIENTTGEVAWTKDSRFVFYTFKDSLLRPSAVYRHDILQPYEDKLVFSEKDNTFRTHVFTTKSNDYIIISTSNGVSSECWYLNSKTPLGNFKLIASRKNGFEYSVDHSGKYFYFLTNYKAKNFRVLRAPTYNPNLKNWQEIIPADSSVLILTMEAFKNHLVTTERRDALTKVKVTNLQTLEQHYIDFGEDVYIALPSINPEYNTNLFYYFYTSLTTPGSTCEYNMTTRKIRLIKQNEVLGGFDPSNYESKRIWATASDGAKIPISMVYKKGIEFSKETPLLLYGYGAYGYSINTTFDPNLVSLLDRGVVYSIAHVRGGQEMGRHWYEQGKLLNKKNTFTDFIACAEKLIADGYTSSDMLIAHGSSAGGMLMGAVANMRPDLFKAIVAEVPFVDVLTTMLDSTKSLTTVEYNEWGNPNDSTFYYYIKSYSPYDQVKEQDYPNMLITAGYNDNQVQYYEPVKWAAKLREYNTGNSEILLWVNMGLGHSQSSGRYSQLNDEAFVYAYMLKQWGITD